MSHAGFIVAAYLVTGILLGGLIIVSALDYRRQRQRLSEREAVDQEKRS